MKKSALLFIIGYLLSPFSWWNDVIINLPLAYIIAFPFGLISEKLFLPILILGYWMTNLLGLILIHYSLLGNQQRLTRREDIFKNLLVALFYTALVLLLARFGLLKFPLHYFK
ncbi:MAG: hypothetical protein ABIL39_08080 [candidate division WOR-3 bacterium]